jgi:ketosteroid isomerase-like protein
MSALDLEFESDVNRPTRSMAETGTSLIKRFFASAKSLDDYVSFFTPDAVYRFGNQPPARGRDAIREGAMRFRSKVQRVAHDVKGMWEVDDVVVCEMEITYTLPDGRTVTLPCCDLFRIEGDHIRDMRVYMDASPVFA